MTEIATTFDIVTSILKDRESINYDEQFHNKLYVPWIVNKALTQHLDTVLYASQMNQYPNIDKKMQYEYLHYSVRKVRRTFQPWIKSQKDDQLKAICSYFNCSKRKGRETINILTENQIKEIMNKLKTTEQK